MIIETPPPYKSDYLAFDFAQEAWQLQQYHAVRKTIFCDEQGLFSGSDRDTVDATALPIVALATCGGMPDRVVGVVRIDERQPGLWYGSRLGVAADYRKLTRFDCYGLFDEHNPRTPFDQSIGAGLIYKAVSTATALGCQQFYANVQIQNVKFFERLHWHSLFTFELFGMMHARMEADLTYYPASQLALQQFGMVG
ncbi:MSMEG_0567/Sll0786 family nitrogen starvation N-acetyltransferase [Hymenobacter sp.]|jgi:hypothetical protein|uniref:MSMEG_0567/Sll0786 family nitrogen starvation N-acetyltransferase n=1 Tax=Hymenobacter sp. TaxID=1898978 RepID=UPI002ED8A3F2